MRIISRKRDYYDGVQGMAHDPHPVFVREEKEEKIERKDWPLVKLDSHHKRYNIGIHDNVVGFCGRVYPSVRVWNARDHHYGSDKSLFCYNIEEFDKAVETLGFREDEVEAYHAKIRWNKRPIFPYRKNVLEFYEAFDRKKDSYGKMFEDNLTAVFVGEYHASLLRGWLIWDKAVITYNGLLKPYDFMKLFDPYMAFQEISMYLGNMAFPDNKIPHVPDEVLAEAKAKGFDKFSFRKDKRQSS